MSAKMSAAFGAGVGITAGYIAGGFIAPYVKRKFPGVTAYDDELAVSGVIGVASILGAVIGAAVGAGIGCDLEPKQVGTSGVGMYLGGNRSFP